MKVILSRKGFDQKYGGSPSPYFVEEGILYSFPIPNDDNYYTYRDLRFNHSLSCYELMDQLGVETRDMHAHTDPDIRKDLFYQPEADWMPILGQQDKADSHLWKQGIRKDDIFLFYGLFQEVKKQNGQYAFVPDTQRHIIWGYMQVGADPMPITPYAPERKHPHFYCKEDYLNQKVRNTAYIGRNTLSADNVLPGYGTFRYADDLVLSVRPGKGNFSTWRLPYFFYECKMTCRPGAGDWFILENDPNHSFMYNKRQGQEFVIPYSNSKSQNCKNAHSAEAVEWAINLIRSSYDK